MIDVICSEGGICASDAPPADDNTAIIGEHVGITCSDEDCLTVTVTKPSFHKSYPGKNYMPTDKPASGHVFLQFYVTYKATGPDADYNQYDWAAYVNGETNSDLGPSLVFNGPNPQLHSGDLRVGKSASGWVILEVPTRGSIAIAYADDVFEITVR